MTITEMKAKCYDLLAQLEFIQKQLQQANKELQDKLNEQSSPVQELEIVKD